MRFLLKRRAITFRGFIRKVLNTIWDKPMSRRAYLRHVLENIANHPINRIEELLPWKVAANLQPETHPVK